MRLIYAAKHLFKNYWAIMPTYLLSALGLFLVSHLAPIIGTILILPISIGVASVMLSAAKEKKHKIKLPILLGFKPTLYVRNVVFLALRQVYTYLPLLIGTVISSYLLGLFDEFTFDINIVIVNLLIFALPAAIVSLMLSMVPYLIADESFDHRKHNPLKVSAKIMRGHYMRLILVRLFFAPWIAVQASGLVYLLLAYYNRLFDGNAPEGILRPTIFIAPIVILFFLPWYKMIHAELYVSLRHKVRKYR